MNTQYEATYGRKRRVVVLDPLFGVVYSKRPGCRLKEDGALQELYNAKGKNDRRLFHGINDTAHLFFRFFCQYLVVKW